MTQISPSVGLKWTRRPTACAVKVGHDGLFGSFVYRPPAAQLAPVTTFTSGNHTGSLDKRNRTLAFPLSAPNSPTFAVNLFGHGNQNCVAFPSPSSCLWCPAHSPPTTSYSFIAYTSGQALPRFMNSTIALYSLSRHAGRSARLGVGQPSLAAPGGGQPRRGCRAAQDRGGLADPLLAGSRHLARPRTHRAAGQG